MNITDIKPDMRVTWTTVDADYIVMGREEDPAKKPFVMIKAVEPDTQPQLACVPAWDLVPSAPATAAPTAATNR